MALQREILKEHGPAKKGRHGADDGSPDAPGPSIVIVLLNNNGGAIFDMLPQASDDPYFERLFLAPQDVRFTEAAADAFMAALGPRAARFPPSASAYARAAWQRRA